MFFGAATSIDQECKGTKPLSTNTHKWGDWPSFSAVTPIRQPWHRQKKGCLFNVTRKWMKKHGPTTHKVNNENRECEREKNKQCMPTNMNNVKMHVLLRNKAHGVHCGAVWCTIALVPHRNSPHTCMCCTMHSDETSHYSQIAHWAPQQDMHHLSVFGHKRKCHDGF